MPRPCLILCEKSSQWAAALRSTIRPKNLPITETRSLAACASALLESPAPLVAIEISAANLEPALELISRAAARHPSVAIVALLSPDAAAAELLIREAGAIDVLSSVLEAPRLARLAQRHFRNLPESASTLEQFVADRLPWPAHATDRSTAQ